MSTPPKSDWSEWFTPTLFLVVLIVGGAAFVYYLGVALRFLAPFFR